MRILMWTLLALALVSCSNDSQSDVDALQAKTTSPEDAIERYLRENGSEDMIEAVLATREEYISMEAGDSANSGVALTDSKDRFVFAICAKVQLSLLI